MRCTAIQPTSQTVVLLQHTAAYEASPLHLKGRLPAPCFHVSNAFEMSGRGLSARCCFVLFKPTSDSAKKKSTQHTHPKGRNESLCWSLHTPNTQQRVECALFSVFFKSTGGPPHKLDGEHSKGWLVWLVEESNVCGGFLDARCWCCPAFGLMWWIGKTGLNPVVFARVVDFTLFCRVVCGDRERDRERERQRERQRDRERERRCDCFVVEVLLVSGLEESMVVLHTFTN